MQDDLTSLRDELGRLRTENEALRAQLRTLAMAPAATPSVSPDAANTQVVSGSRRWVGRALALAIALGGFALGVGYARWAGTEVLSGFRDHYDPSSPPAVEAPATPPPESP